MVQQIQRQIIQRQVFPRVDTRRQLFPESEPTSSFVESTAPVSTSLRELNADKISALKIERNKKRDILKRKLKRTGSRREIRKLKAAIEKITRFYAGKIFFLRKGRHKGKPKNKTTGIMTKQAEKEYQAGKKVLAITSKLPTGGTQTVTKSGKVTIRENGKVEIFKISSSKARQILGKGKIALTPSKTSLPWWLQPGNIKSTGGYRPMTTDYQKFLQGKIKSKSKEDINKLLDQYKTGLTKKQKEALIEGAKSRMTKEALDRLEKGIPLSVRKKADKIEKKLKLLMPIFSRSKYGSQKIRNASLFLVQENQAISKDLGSMKKLAPSFYDKFSKGLIDGVKSLPGLGKAAISSSSVLAFRVVPQYVNLLRLKSKYKSNPSKQNLLTLINHELNLETDIKNQSKKFKDLILSEETKFIASTVKQITLGLTEFPLKVLIGLKDNLKGSLIFGQDIFAETIGRSINNLKQITSLYRKLNVADKKIKSGKTVPTTEIKKINILLKDIGTNVKLLGNEKQIWKNATKEASKVLNTPESKLFRLILVITTIGAIAPQSVIVPISKISSVGFAAVSTREFIKNPTPKQFGRTAFYTLPIALSFVKRVRALGPTIKPSVHNVGTVKDLLVLKKSIMKKGLKISNKVKDTKLSKQIKKDIINIDKKITDVNKILNDPNFIKMREYNPQVAGKYVKRVSSATRELYHISTEKKLAKMFGKTIEKPLTAKQIKALDLKKILGPTKIKGKVKPLGLPFTQRRKINIELLKLIKKEQHILTGSAAQNLYVAKKYRRTPGDFDIKAKNPSQATRKIFNALKKKFPDANFKLVKLKLANRIKLNGKDLLDVAKIEKGVAPITIQGFKVASKQFLLKKKLSTVPSPAEKFFRRGEKDIADVVRLTEGKFTRSDLILKSKNPSTVFEIARFKGGMGPSRLKFDETHFYFDYEGAVGYAQGKAYSIIRFPLAKVNKFPKHLVLKINKAIKGRLSIKQQNTLRMQLNNYIKKNPNKMFKGPRAAAQGMGEREVVSSVSGKLFKKELWKTFDRELQTFIQGVDVGFSGTERISYLTKLSKALKQNHLKILKYKVGQNDLLKIRSIQKLLKSNVAPTPKQISFYKRIANMIISLKTKIKGVLGLNKTQTTQIKSSITKFTNTKVKKLNSQISTIKKKIKTSKGKDLIKHKKELKQLETQVKKIKQSDKNILNSIKKDEKVLKDILKKAPKGRKIPERDLSRIIKRAWTRVRVSPRVSPRVKPRVRPRIIKRVRIKPRTRSRPRTAKRIIERVRPRVRPKVKARVRPKVRPGVKPRVRPRVRPRHIPKVRPPPPLKRDTKKETIKKLKKSIRYVKKRKFSFTSDLYSRFFGLKATKREAKVYLNPKRVFSGLEMRKVIKK